MGTRKLAVTVLVAVAATMWVQPVWSGQRPPRDWGVGAGQIRVGTSEISGRVRARTGQSLQRATVVLWSRAGAGLTLAMVTDDRGAYHFERLPAGRYVVQASKAGFGRRFHGEDHRSRLPAVVEVEPGQHVRGVDLVLPQGAVVTGRVHDEEGRSLPLVNVFLLRPAEGQMVSSLAVVGSDVTDDRGVYRIFDQEPGMYYVRGVAVSAESLAERERVNVSGSSGNAVTAASDGYAPTYYPGTTRLAQARRVNVRESREVNGVDFPVVRVPLGAVSGVVVAPPGANPVGTEVTLTPTDGAGVVAGNTHSTWVEAGGRFSFPGIPEGRYILTATGSTSNGDIAFGRQAVVVNGERLDGLLVVLTPGTEVTGTVRFEGAAPQWRDIVNLQVTTRMLDTTQARGDDQSMLDDDNRFQVRGLPPGLRVFGIAGVDETRVLERISLNGRDITDRPIDVGGRSRVTGLEVFLTDRVSSLAGAVRTASDGEAAVVVAFSTTPELWFPNSRHVRVERPAQSGRYRIHGIPPGDYWVTAAPLSASASDGWLSPRFLERLRTRAARVSVRKGDTVTADLQARGR